jgi:hemerythrin superfamily protein
MRGPDFLFLDQESVPGRRKERTAAMNLYLLLHQDHVNVRSLFDQIEASGEEETELRERLFASLSRELDLHSEAEERFLYGRLRISDRARAPASQSLDDHKGMKRLLAELGAMDPGTPEWTGKCRVLRAECEAHILREERDLFPLAQEILGDEEAAGIAEDIGAYKEERAGIEIG